jgi:hypothetical protein
MDNDAAFMAMWDELGRPGFRHRENYEKTFRLLECIGAESMGDKRARNQQQRLDEALRVGEQTRVA